MAETKQEHTPGPWHVIRREGIDYIVGPEGLRHTVGKLWSIAQMTRGTTPQEDDANAALIAAAPDQNKALRLLLADEASPAVQAAKQKLFRLAPEIEQAARAAITKAKP